MPRFHRGGPLHIPFARRCRLIPFKTPATGGATGLCLEPHDRAVSKLVAGREKDLTYIAALIRHRIADPRIIAERLETTPLTDEARDLCRTRLHRLSAP